MSESVTHQDAETVLDASVPSVSDDSTHDDTVRCADAIVNVQAFLRGELDLSLADEIREHLMACETCLDNFHVEELITSMIKRCAAHPECCSETLRARLTTLHVTLP
ncbi:MAG: zf-HC2 domain-containing protein [Propionibacteriaceae bacterium]|jgi:anti-sigma factor (TIGR02949 family)|nr:zf-HC2 domain-containing protein [Propionibacteriaceae bacterium]